MTQADDILKKVAMLIKKECTSCG